MRQSYTQKALYRIGQDALLLELTERAKFKELASSLESPSEANHLTRDESKAGTQGCDYELPYIVLPHLVWEKK